MEHTYIKIKGMHCRSCEILVEDELLKITGVESCHVNQKKGYAKINLSKPVSDDQFEAAVTSAGYELGEEVKKPWFSHRGEDYFGLIVSLGFLLSILLIGRSIGLDKIGFVKSNDYSSLPVVFLIGLTAGLSTCMALVGGLVLGAAARFAEKHPTATTVQKFKPHLFFNIGRIVSFVILGGVIGYLGSLFQLSTSVLGILTIIVGLMMLFLGLQLTELFPRLSSVSLTFPKGISKALGLSSQNKKEYSHKNAAILGALSFFLPCGFTQTMQLFAMSSASPLVGSLTMGIFALGTAPGLLGIGGLTAIIKGSFAKPAFRFVGVLVVLLAVYNISNGLTLSGFNNLLPESKNYTPVPSVSAEAESKGATDSQGLVNSTNEIQQLQMLFSNQRDISPSEFTVKQGVPVRMNINASEEGYGCMASFVIPGVSNQITMLKEGNNVYEFTPNKAGTYQITCAMGIPRGVLKVV